MYPQERGCERLFYGIGVDTRRLKGERETKDHLKKDCLKRGRQGGVEELECDQRRWHATEGRAENVTALCAYWRNGR